MGNVKLADALACGCLPGLKWSLYSSSGCIHRENMTSPPVPLVTEIVSPRPSWSAPQPPASAMMYCSVPRCGSKMGQSKDVVMHEFPSNMERRERWIAAVRALRPQDSGDPWLPSEYAKVCSKHFTPDDYIQGPKKRYLAPHAVPSQFQSTATGKAGKGRRGRPRKIRKEETPSSVSAASALANKETATKGDLDRTPPATGRTNKPVVIRHLRGDEASASECQSPVPVIVEVRSESCDVGSVFRTQDPMPVIVDVRSECRDSGSAVSLMAADKSLGFRPE
ncbi:hypothetical protein HPB48_002324 [Haemaphysalis longicornis]|uniref:THAP-type domain-containing protein n=1 Tax=Haemaphysalis longicornis TaxID=44386 RepID=A0A9J6FS84_HAELO|nr:hypothetical protein HPB48_002324 [Haemaphysalis longicornis]